MAPAAARGAEIAANAAKIVPRSAKSFPRRSKNACVADSLRTRDQPHQLSVALAPASIVWMSFGADVIAFSPLKMFVTTSTGVLAVVEFPDAALGVAAAAAFVFVTAASTMAAWPYEIAGTVEAATVSAVNVETIAGCKRETVKF